MQRLDSNDGEQCNLQISSNMEVGGIRPFYLPGSFLISSQVACTGNKQEMKKICMMHSCTYSNKQQDR